MVTLCGSTALGAGEIGEFKPKDKSGEPICPASAFDAADGVNHVLDCGKTVGEADADDSDFKRCRSSSKTSFSTCANCCACRSLDKISACATLAAS
eukprot:1209786-Karenia_brevis.AAC.1